MFAKKNHNSEIQSNKFKLQRGEIHMRLIKIQSNQNRQAQLRKVF